VLTGPVPASRLAADRESQAPGIELQLTRKGDAPRIGWLTTVEGVARAPVSLERHVGPIEPSPAVMAPARLYLTKRRDATDDSAPYRLAVQAPLEGGAGGAPAPRERIRIEWEVGKEYPLPHTQATLRVLAYLPAARPVYTKVPAAPVLIISKPDGSEEVVSAEVGGAAKLEEQGITLRIAKVYTHLRMKGNVATNDGPAPNHALKIELQHPGGSKTPQFVYVYRRPMYAGTRALPLRYEVPTRTLTGARADPGSPSPAIKLSFSHDGKQTERWLVVAEGRRQASMSLAEFADSDGAPHEEGDTRPASQPSSRPGAGSAEAPDTRPASQPASCPMVGPAQHAGHHLRGARLAFIRPGGPDVKDWKSSLVILEEGQEAHEKVIEVNHPMHYGGYYFYQHDFQHDPETDRWSWSVIHVRSDSGIIPVCAGFLLLCVGVFWHLWLRPAWRYYAKTTTEQ